MDNKITDKGWAAMRSLLDREMPEKRRRRFGWWWCLILLVPIAGYGSWQWFSGLAPEGQPQVENSTPPIAQLAPETGANNETEPNPIASEVQKQILESHNPAAFSVKASPLKNTATTSTFAALPEMPPSSTSANALPQPMEALNQAEERSLQSILSLPTPLYPFDLTTATLAYTPHTAAITTLKPVQKAAYKRWAIGAFTAISTEQFNGINGFSTGVTVDRKFARKWGLRTGLLYNLQTPQEKYRPVASVQSEDYASNVNGNVILLDVYTGQELNVPGGVPYADSLSGNVFIPVRQLQRLELPITTFWQPNKALKIFSGCSFTRTLSTHSDKQNYSGDYILKLTDQNAEDDASKLSSSELDNWSVDALLGVGFQLGKTFELGLTAKMPLKKFSGLLKADENAALNTQADNDAVGATQKQSSPLFSLYGTLFF